MQVAGHFITCSISVLEQKSGPQFIFGLDMLRRHACCIDLAKGVSFDCQWWLAERAEEECLNRIWVGPQRGG
jgi:hypothetical protein